MYYITVSISLFIIHRVGGYPGRKPRVGTVTYAIGSLYHVILQHWDRKLSVLQTFSTVFMLILTPVVGGWVKNVQNYTDEIYGWYLVLISQMCNVQTLTYLSPLLKTKAKNLLVHNLLHVRTAKASNHIQK